MKTTVKSKTAIPRATAGHSYFADLACGHRLDVGEWEYVTLELGDEVDCQAEHADPPTDEEVQRGAAAVSPESERPYYRAMIIEARGQGIDSAGVLTDVLNRVHAHGYVVMAVVSTGVDRWTVVARRASPEDPQ